MRYAQTAVAVGECAVRLTVFVHARSFWNFDALFQPQQHPARDAHDTFFVTSAPSFNIMAGNMWGIHPFNTRFAISIIGVTPKNIQCFLDSLNIVNPLQVLPKACNEW